MSLGTMRHQTSLSTAFLSLAEDDEKAAKLLHEFGAYRQSCRGARKTGH